MIRIPCRAKGCDREGDGRNTMDDDGVVRGHCLDHDPMNREYEPTPQDEE